MTQEDVIEMAQKCGLIGMRPHLDGIYSEALESFAKLVAEKSASVEREACAKVCGDLMLRENPYERWEGMKWCMDRIRARGEA